MRRGLGRMQRVCVQAFDAIVARRPTVCTCPESSLTRLCCTGCPARTGYSDREGQQRYQALNQHLCHQGQSSALTCGRAAMTNRVSGNDVTISAVKLIEGLPENTLPYRLYPMWH